MRSITFSILLFISLPVNGAGIDTTYLKRVYDHCLDFNEAKIDSLKYYAFLIETESRKLNFEKGPVLSLRLMGLYEELQSDYKKAIDYYLQSLEASRKLSERVYEVSALSDLAILYYNIGQPQLSRKYYVQCAQLALEEGELSSVVNSYNNLGVIYNGLGLHDSALVFLNLALRIGRQSNGQLDTTATINNIGNSFFKKKDFVKALFYFNKNYLSHLGKEVDPSLLWIDHINLSDVYIELAKYDSALFHSDEAMKIALSLESKTKQADGFSIYSKLYGRKGDYRKAYEYMQKWYSLDTALVNGSTQQTIAELQERFNAKEREAENKILMAKVETEAFQIKMISIVASVLAVFLGVIVFALLKIRRFNKRLKENNELIGRQNEKLSALNYEKNQLIGVVSHDLNSPFATIGMWSQVLESEVSGLSPDQQKAIHRIKEAGSQGQQLIQRILDVERSDIANYELQLKNFELLSVFQSVCEAFSPMAGKKSIQLIQDYPENGGEILSDPNLVRRVLENLLSNAIKFSEAGSRIWIDLKILADTVQFSVKDEGVGIPADELPRIFSRYGNISSRSTAGEKSNGIGLSIVKRIVDELNGTIRCQSAPGLGTSFIVELKK